MSTAKETTIFGVFPRVIITNWHAPPSPLLNEFLLALKSGRTANSSHSRVSQLIFLFFPHTSISIVDTQKV